MNTLAFCGYDFRNIGDDAFMSVFARHTLNSALFSNIRLTSSYLPDTETTSQITPIYANMTARKGAHLYRLLQHSWPIHLFAVVGGSVLHDACHFERECWKLRLLKTLNPRMKVAALGVSIGPITTQKALLHLKRYLSYFDYVSVRDKPSQEILEHLRIPCPVRKYFDLAALLEWDQGKAHAHDIKTRRLTLGIAPCHVQRYRSGEPQLDNKRCDYIAKSLNIIARQQDIRIKFFECNGHPAQGDLPAIQQIREKLLGRIPVEVVRYRPSPTHFLKEIAGCNALIAMRLHAAIFAFLSKTPITSLAYHPKCDGFVKEIGLSSTRRINANSFNPDELSHAVQNTLVERENGSLTIDAAKKSASRHFVDLFNLLKF